MKLLIINRKTSPKLLLPLDNQAEIIEQTKPNVGFCGIGWIGKNRLLAIHDNHSCNIKAAVDPDTSVINKLKQEISDIQSYESFEDMLESDIEGVVIASPSALHAAQALKALEKGKAVFCQKPLGRNEKETREVVKAARERDLLLGVDFSYRYSEAAQIVKKTIQSGELGRIFGINLIFHNAYGPGKTWYYDVRQSGGGCVMDLGIHLIDLLFWVMDDPQIDNIHSHLFHNGNKLEKSDNEVEDYATAQFTVNDNAAAQLTCSWNLSAGKDAIIEASFYGEKGGIAFRNRDGSFYDFVSEKYTGTSAQILTEPPDSWPGKAAVRWSNKLAENNRYDPETMTYVKVSRTLDLIYKNSS